MLNSRITVALPDKGIIVRRSGKYKQVFKVTNTFRNEKGQPTNTRVLIGRLDTDETRLVPNSKYFEIYGSASETIVTHEYKSIVSAGMTFLVSHILSYLGVKEFLTEALGARRAQAVITAATYMTCEGNVLEYIDDWCERSFVDEAPLSPQKASALFSSITHTERMSFFAKWVSANTHSGYLSYDVTSFSSYSEGIRDTEWGYNRDGDRLPQINLGCYLSQGNCLPIFYVTYPGSIVDKSHLPYMMAYNEELGIGDDIIFVMDRGFCSTHNVDYMHEEALNYVMGVDTRSKATKDAIDSVRDGLISRRNLITEGVYGIAVHSRFFGERSSLHIYSNPELGEYQRRDMYRLVSSQGEELQQLSVLAAKDIKRFRRFFDLDVTPDGFSYAPSYERIDEAARNSGIFCILTNTGLCSDEVLSVFRRKDTIEKGFDDLKNHIDMKRLRVHSDATLDGKMFCAFISLIAVSEISNRLNSNPDSDKRKRMSKRTLILELEKIKVLITSDGSRFLNPLTKVQRDIISLFGATIDDLSHFTNPSR